MNCWYHEAFLEWRYCSNNKWRCSTAINRAGGREGGGVERLARFVENSTRVEEVGGSEGRVLWLEFHLRSYITKNNIPNIYIPHFIHSGHSEWRKAGCLDEDTGNIPLLLRNNMQIIYKLKSVLCLSSIGYEDTELKI